MATLVGGKRNEASINRGAKDRTFASFSEKIAVLAFAIVLFLRRILR